jgi:hypothetical protein
MNMNQTDSVNMVWCLYVFFIFTVNNMFFVLLYNSLNTQIIKITVDYNNIKYLLDNLTTEIYMDSTETGTDTDTDTETGSDTETETGSDSDTETETGSDTETETGSDTETETGSDTLGSPIDMYPYISSNSLKWRYTYK